VPQAILLILATDPAHRYHAVPMPGFEPTTLWIGRRTHVLTIRPRHSLLPRGRPAPFLLVIYDTSSNRELSKVSIDPERSEILSVDIIDKNVTHHQLLLSAARSNIVWRRTGS
jgi:hypothetical protein